MFRLLIAAMLLWCGAHTAAAQDKPEQGTEAPVADAPQDADTAGANNDVQERANANFEAGNELAAEGKCDAAIVEFEASVSRFVQPAPLLAMARCEEKLYRYASAMEHYQRYLDVAEDDDAQKAEVQRTLSALQRRLGTVKIRAAKPAQVWLGGHVIGNAPSELMLPAGRHVLEFRIEGHAAQRRSVEVRARKRSEVFVEIDRKMEIAPSHSDTDRTTHAQVDRSLQQDTEDEGLDPTLFWIGAGLTVATATAGTVFGLQARAKRDEAEKIDPRISREAEIEEIQTASRTADILFGTAAVLGIATAITAIFTDWESDDEVAAPAEPSLALTPALSPSSVGLVVQGAM